MKITLGLISLTFLLLTGCNNSSSGGKTTPPEGGQGQSCKMTGSWVRCSSYGPNNSTKVSIQATDTTIHEVIENFSSVADCSGASDSDFAFDANYSLAATADQNVHDADLVPTVDLFGCGAGQPAYTRIKFSSDCNEFQSTTEAPACAPEDRGTTFDPQPFLRTN